MTAQTNEIEVKPGMVHAMRSIRDELNREIKDMTFEEERAYLNGLLAAKKDSTENESEFDANGEEAKQD